MLTIHKYEIEPETIVHLPERYKILSVQVQRERPCVWILLDPSLDRNIAVELKVYGTGHDVPLNCGDFIGTFQLNNGSLVFHLFAKELK